MSLSFSLFLKDLCIRVSRNLSFSLSFKILETGHIKNLTMDMPNNIMPFPIKIELQINHPINRSSLDSTSVLGVYM